METGSRTYGGSRLVAWATLLVAANFGVTAIWAGLDPEGVHVLLRSTARVAGALFLLPFTASALQRLFAAPWTRWLVRNRRWLGLSFAVGHLGHLISIGLYVRDTDEVVEASAVALGGLAYVGTLFMAATSTDAAQRRLRSWRTLHRVSAYWIWLVFTTTFAGAAASHALSAAFAGLMVLALAVRLAPRLPALARA